MKRTSMILSTSVAIVIALTPLTTFAHGLGGHGSKNSHQGAGQQSSQGDTHGNGQASGTSVSGTVQDNHTPSNTNQSATSSSGSTQSLSSGNTTVGTTSTRSGTSSSHSHQGSENQSATHHQGNPSSTTDSTPRGTLPVVVKNKEHALAKELTSLPNHPAIPALPKSLQNNKTIKPLMTSNQQLQKEVTNKETVLKKEMQTLLSQINTSSSSQLSTTSLQSVNQTVQKAVNLGKSLPTRSNKGGLDKGLARALTMLKANEARMKQEISALTTAIQKIEALLQQTTSPTTVTGAVYGTNGSTNGTSSSNSTTSTSSSTT